MGNPPHVQYVLMHVRAPQARGYLGECSFATVPTVRSRERAPCYLLPTDRAGGPRPAPRCLWVSGCHTRATQRCRCRGRSSNARTGCALVPAHRQGRGTTTLTWGRGSPLLSLQGHECLPTDRAGAPQTTHVEGAHHCYTAGSLVHAGNTAMHLRVPTLATPQCHTTVKADRQALLKIE